VTPQEIAVPEPELVQFRAIRGVEQSEIALEVGWLDEAGLELRERGSQRVREAGEPGGSAEPVEDVAETAVRTISWR